MTEAKVAARQLPLDQLHRNSGATMFEIDGWSVPVSYGDELLEYAVVRERGAGLLDLSSRGRLLVTGSEAVAFLNGLITNDMKTLAEHRWMPAVFPNVQGRLLASVRVIRLADDGGKPSFLIDTEPASRDRVLQTIQRFTLAGDFHVTDLTTTTALLSLQGKAASDKLNKVLSNSTSELAGNQVLQTSWQDQQISVTPATHTRTSGYDLFVSEPQAALLWHALVKTGARPVGYDALEILRIEAGVPRYGLDMDDTTVVTETNLDEAVSYTKGCYVGQEIIARIKYRGHVAKKLRGLSFDGPAIAAPQQIIKSADDKEIGHITSTTYSPHLGQQIALVYVKYDHIAAGTTVKTDDGTPANVVDLPFINQIENVG
jgi:folate-binding protein YgfZ